MPAKVSGIDRSEQKSTTFTSMLMTGIAKHKAKVGLLLTHCLLAVNLLFYFLSPLSTSAFSQYGENALTFMVQGETLTGSIFDDSQLYTSSTRATYPPTKFKAGFDPVSLTTGINCITRHLITGYKMATAKTSHCARVTPLFKLYCALKIPFNGQI